MQNAMSDYDRIKYDLSVSGFDRFCVHSSDISDVTEDRIVEYEEILDSSANEKPLQQYLEKYPQFLVTEIGGMCRWVIPQKSFGGKYFSDFVVGRLDSPGLRWTLVELQSPRDPLFLSNNLPGEHLREGIGQIESWRRWIANNRDEACRSPHRDGLGLVDISHASLGLVLVGREDNRAEHNRQLIEQLWWTHRIDIRSYDWLARDARRRIERRARYRESFPGDLCEECRS